MSQLLPIKRKTRARNALPYLHWHLQVHLQFHGHRDPRVLSHELHGSNGNSSGIHAGDMTQPERADLWLGRRLERDALREKLGLEKGDEEGDAAAGSAAPPPSEDKKKAADKGGGKGGKKGEAAPPLAESTGPALPPQVEALRHLSRGIELAARGGHWHQVQVTSSAPPPSAKPISAAQHASPDVKYRVLPMCLLAGVL